VRIFGTHCHFHSSFSHANSPLRKKNTHAKERQIMTIDIDHLREAVRIAEESRACGSHPFGALLVGPNGEVLHRSLNTVATDGGTGHAEANAAREAARLYTPDFLSGCTLYTSVEPCCMCAGASYWAGIGAIVFGLTERRLAELTGDNPENLTLDLDCRSVFAAGRRPVEVRGPFAELETEIVKGHDGFW
jgi:tRNA(Arg) A34 adenosine deaminase TadA